MADYQRQHDFSTKTGQPILGQEFDDEFDELVTAVNSKTDESREGAANGVATLDGLGQVPQTQLGNVPTASETQAGLVERATLVEAAALTDTTRYITPDSLEHVLNLAAGSALSWSGTQFSVDIASLGAVNPAAGDSFIYYDADGLDYNRVTFSDLESTLNHDNLAGFVANEHVDHSAVSITAGNGLTGGGTIASSRTLDVVGGTGITVAADSVSFNPGTLASLPVSSVSVANDGIVVSDSGTAKVMPWDQAGVKVVTTTGSQTFALSDANTCQVLTGTTSRTWTIPPNSTTAFTVGTVIICCARDNATITITAGTGVSLSSTNHTSGTAQSDSVKPGGTACLIKVGTDDWMLGGDIDD